MAHVILVISAAPVLLVGLSCVLWIVMRREPL